MLCVFSSFRVVLAFMALAALVLFLDLFLYLDHSDLQYTRTHMNECSLEGPCLCICMCSPSSFSWEEKKQKSGIVADAIE